jgi:outer membrane receptor protein involved in Fe transport
VARCNGYSVAAARHPVVWKAMRGAAAIVSLVLALAAGLAAQGRVLRGIVVGGDGLPIGGAQLRDGTARARSGPDGRFAIAAEGEALIVTAPGYASARVAVPNGALRIELRPQALSETVTVAATGRNQEIAKAPLATAVMGRGRLEGAAPSNVDSVLRQFSDLGTFRTDSSLTANPTTQGVALLGTGSSGASRALVLLDELPLNDFYGGWVDWLRVPEEDLSSVSVVSGGASPLYGNDALSGVIALRTQAPTATHLDVRTGGGGLGTALADGAGVIAGRKLALAVRGRGVHVAGYVPAAQPGAVDDRAGVAAQDWAPEVRWLASPAAMFTLSSEYFAENRTNGTVAQVNGTRLRQMALAGVVERDGVWQGNVFAQSEDFHANFSAVAANRNSEKLTLEQQVPSHASGGGLDWTLAGRRWSVMAGGSMTHIAAVDNETLPSAPLAPAREENGRQALAGGFVEASWRARAHWRWTGTLRRDGWTNYDAFQNTPGGVTPYPNVASTAWSPSLGTVWAPEGWLSLHASGYESFRAPTLNELYRPFRVGNVLTEDNPTLGAERYRGAQVGGVANVRPGLRLQATYFDGIISNLVTSVTLTSTPALITRQRQNLGRVEAGGVTLGGEWQARPGLTLWASYTHLRSTVTAAAQASLVGLAVAHVPENNFSAEALGRGRGWTLSAVERFGGASFDDDQNTLLLPGFWTTDVFASRRFGRFAPYLAVENLWNRRYAIELTPDAFLNAPRAVTAGVRIEFGGGR